VAKQICRRKPRGGAADEGEEIVAPKLARLLLVIVSKEAKSSKL
jgi:hypothetical protein